MLGDASDIPAARCALVPVAANIDVAVIRIPAEGARIGSLFVNPGGPGGSAVDGALITSAFIPMEEYSLDFVARKVIGEGKLLSAKDRAGEILDVDQPVQRPDRAALDDRVLRAGHR